ncbi:hypothetical protein HYX10_01550 [Candidatus Woesearchaeota archaeon]|nr:hypothetical protein [Candidatus Woesearchaeota archaeon]
MDGYIESVKSKYSLEKIKQILAQLKRTKVLAIGDTIIDEYHFTIPKGRATKDPILSVDYKSHEVYAGGILAVANHASGFVDKVTCVTAIGDRDDRKDFINESVKKNVALKYFIKKNSPTTTKKRYLDAVRNEKLFKVEFINEEPIDGETEKELMSFLGEELPKHDLVLVGDFGHGFITENIIRFLEGKTKFLAVNAQCNSANLGFNFVTQYSKPAYITMDITELQYAVADRFSPVHELMRKLQQKSNFNHFLVTMGRQGAGYFNNGQLTFSPAFVIRPVDTVGAGDAVFTVTSLFAHAGITELIPFIANCAGGIAVSYLGNKESVNADNLIQFVEKTYNGEATVMPSYPHKTD